MIDFKIKNTILIKQRHGLDKLCLEVDWPNPFPDSKDTPSLDISVAKGYGEKYANLIGIEINEVIDMGTIVSKFSKQISCKTPCDTCAGIGRVEQCYDDPVEICGTCDGDGEITLDRAPIFNWER